MSFLQQNEMEENMWQAGSYIDKFRPENKITILFHDKSRIRLNILSFSP